MAKVLRREYAQLLARHVELAVDFRERAEAYDRARADAPPPQPGVCSGECLWGWGGVIVVGLGMGTHAGNTCRIVVLWKAGGAAASRGAEELY